MTLADFRRDTAELSGSLEIFVLDPWGNLGGAAFVTPEDLADGDPLIDDLPENGLVMTGEAV